MEPYQYFIMPIMDDKAQVAIIALMTLALLIGALIGASHITAKE